MTTTVEDIDLSVDYFESMRNVIVPASIEYINARNELVHEGVAPTPTDWVGRYQYFYMVQRGPSIELKTIWEHDIPKMLTDLQPNYQFVGYSNYANHGEVMPRFKYKT